MMRSTLSYRTTFADDAIEANSAGIVPIALVVAAVMFNAVFAFLNARVQPIGGGPIIAAEVLIVALSHIYVLRHFQERMVKWYFLALAVAVFAILRVSATDNVDAKYFRDVFLIITFILLGMTSDTRRVIQMMMILQVFVVAGVALEAICLPCYSDFFAPKDFYISTRGVNEEEFTNLASDLYVSATRPEARFLPFFDLHRMSSIFLEPVSLGNFMIVTVVFTVAFWSRMGNAARAFSVFTAILTLLACDGRLAALASVAIIAMSAAHRLMPRHAALLFIPLISGLAVAYTELANLQSGVDDLNGRIAYAAELITGLTALDLAGLSDRILAQSVDAGVVYLVITQSLLGLALIWGTITLAANEATREQKIYKNGLLLYLALTMIVSYSFLTIKTAAPIWFIYGALLATPATSLSTRADAWRSRHGRRHG